MAYRKWGLISLFSTAALTVFEVLGTATEYLFAALAWPFVVAFDWVSGYFAPDAAATLRLNDLRRASRTERQPAAERFKAFMSRALSHPFFSAGHFDPGRMPA